jgi:hypothetical protein
MKNGLLRVVLAGDRGASLLHDFMGGKTVLPVADLEIFKSLGKYSYDAIF